MWIDSSHFCIKNYLFLQGAVLLYDITNKRSFDDVHEWMQSISIHGSQKVKTVLVGHKSDLEDLRIVTAQEGLLLANTCNIAFFEASSKTGSNCLEIFTTLAESILDDDHANCSINTTIPLSSKRGIVKSDCCN